MNFLYEFSGIINLLVRIFAVYHIFIIYFMNAYYEVGFFFFNGTDVVCGEVFHPKKEIKG